MRYPKPALKSQQHIALLKSRGMTFGNEALAEKFLQNVSYYHAGFYWFDLRRKANPMDKSDNTRLDSFPQNCCFENVIERYYFDMQLQYILTQALKTLETSLKAKWAYHFSHKYDPLFYFNPHHYNVNSLYGKTIRDIIQSIKAKFDACNKEFIVNYKRKHTDNQYPEVWIITEILSFEELLYLILFLKQKDKQELAHLYAENSGTDFLKHGEFIGSLKQLRVVRNICAHNDWLWNKSFNAIPLYPRKSPLLRQAWNTAKPKKIYNTFCYITYLLRSVDSAHGWQKNFKMFMRPHPHYAAAMGFPTSWESAELWQ